MTVAQLEIRVKNLEKVVEELRVEMQSGKTTTRRWWRESAGWFANDPEFEEIVRLGREYRESLRPPDKKVKRDHS